MWIFKKEIDAIPSYRYIPLLVGIVYLSEVQLELTSKLLVSLLVISSLTIATIIEVRLIHRKGAISEDRDLQPSRDIRSIVATSSLFLSLACGAVISRSPLITMLASIALLLTLYKVLSRHAEFSEFKGLWSFLWLSAATIGGHIIYWNYLSVFEHRLLIGVKSVIVDGISELFSGFQTSIVGQHLILNGHPAHISSFSIRSGLPVIFAFFALSRSGTIQRLVRAFLAIMGIMILGVLQVLFLLYIDQPQLSFSKVSQFIMLFASYLLMAVIWRSSALDFDIHIREVISCVVIAICLYAASSFVKWISSNEIHTIAIDERHGSWETVQTTFDTKSYGRDTVYNYALLRQKLEFTYRVQLLNERISEINADLLIVKTPVEFYSQEEKRVIEKFVKNGGVLLAIGDHTNLFGHAMVFNDLLDWSGLRLNSDATLSLTSRHYDFKPHWWNRHYILRGIDRIEFQTSATIFGSGPYVFPFIVGDQIVAEDADYSNDQFFGELIPDISDRHPPLVLGAYRYIGNGKVILFGDSTIWSNFSFFAATNEALFENLLGACTVKIGGILRSVILAIGFGSFIAVYLLGRDWTRTIIVFLIVAMFVFSWHSASLDNEIADGVGGKNRLFIDGTHSSMELRSDTRKGTREDLFDYSTFYAWLSRDGLFPMIVNAHCYESLDIPTIIINPDKPFDNNEISRIDAYLRRGGHVLLLDDPVFAFRSTSAVLLEHFGIFYKTGFSNSGIYDSEGPALSANLLGIPFDMLDDTRTAPGHARVDRVGVKFYLSGTNALLVDEEGFVICGQKEVGRGIITAFYRSSIFSEFIMGDVWGGKEPSEGKLRIYNLAYSLVNTAIGRKVE